VWPIVLPLWIVGGAVAGVISELARAESRLWSLVGRLGFAFALALALYATAAAFDIQYASSVSARYISSSGWWVVTIAGIVLVLATGLALLRPATHKLLHLAATATGAAAFVVFPYAYAPEHEPWRIAFGWVLAVLVVPVALALSAAMPRRASGATRRDAPA
jgi:hypothetical protein